MTTYKHTQPGTLILVIAIALLCLLAYLFYASGSAFVTGILGAVVLVLFSFSSLTVVLTDGHLSFHFGWGIYKKRVALADITNVTVVKNKWWHGWGVHSYGKGWIYNVSGFDAVEVHLKDGSQFRLGSDEAEALKQALTQHLAR